MNLKELIKEVERLKREDDSIDEEVQHLNYAELSGIRQTVEAVDKHNWLDGDWTSKKSRDGLKDWQKLKGLLEIGRN